MQRKNGLPRRMVVPVLCALLVFSFVMNAAAEKAVSVFAATDRHAAYETAAAEKEENEGAEPPEAPPEKPPPGPRCPKRII